MSAYSPDNEAFAALLKYGSVVLFKLLLMAPITSVYRVANATYVSEEDAVVAVGKDKEKQKKVLAKNPSVERVLSAHRNDLENIVPFFLISMLYVATKPEAATAALLFKIFAWSRVVHTIVYLGKVRQPARGLAFMAGFGVNLYMVLMLVKRYWL